MMLSALTKEQLISLDSSASQLGSINIIKDLCRTYTNKYVGSNYIATLCGDKSNRLAVLLSDAPVWVKNLLYMDMHYKTYDFKPNSLNTTPILLPKTNDSVKTIYSGLIRRGVDISNSFKSLVNYARWTNDIDVKQLILNYQNAYIARNYR